MGSEIPIEMQQPCTMKGGDGLYSYVRNSRRQRATTDSAKEMIKMAIAENLEKETLLSSKTFCIADLGCSVGPNTFFAVQNILEALESKYQQCTEPNSQIPEFQVFFCDHTSNDFYLLFTSLPQNLPYHAAGVPGSFYGRLFPKTSLHFVHSSVALHWLSSAPKELMNKNSPAWNKGRIHYSNSGDEVFRAYKAQFDKDMEQFLQARAQEIVHGGSCLTDLAKKGIVSEEKVDSFNVRYITSPLELEVAVARNGYFSIERIEDIHRVESNDQVTNAQKFTCYIRSGMEGTIKQHLVRKS